MRRAGLTRLQEYKFGIYKVALEIQDDLPGLEIQTIEGTRNFINKITNHAKKIVTDKVPVKTGKTKASIKEHPAKYTIATISVETWLDAWVNKGGGSYHVGSVSVTARRGTKRNFRQRWYNTTRNRISINKRHEGHPAYYMLRPTKLLLKSGMSMKTYERYMKLALKKLDQGKIKETDITGGY